MNHFVYETLYNTLRIEAPKTMMKDLEKRIGSKNDKRYRVACTRNTVFEVNLGTRTQNVITIIQRSKRIERRKIKYDKMKRERQ